MLQRISKTVIERGGLPLLEYLSLRYTYHSRDMWRELLAEGRVLVNGSAASPEYMLNEGDELEYLPRPMEEPPVDMNIKVLFQDQDFIALDKPGNLPCHPSGCFFRHTLWALLKEGILPDIPAMDQVRFVNRLDRETSGIVLTAKNAKAASMAAKALKSPSSCKCYKVLVYGMFPDSLEAKGWLYHDEKALVSKRRSFSFDKPAAPSEDCHTSFFCLKRGKGFSLLEARLHTGRTHQIRATLHSLGYPVVGDKLYGPDESIFLRFIKGNMTEKDKMALILPRQALHASRLCFGKYDIYSPLPLLVEKLTGD